MRWMFTDVHEHNVSLSVCLSVCLFESVGVHGVMGIHFHQLAMYDVTYCLISFIQSVILCAEIAKNSVTSSSLSSSSHALLTAVNTTRYMFKRTQSLSNASP